MDSLIIKMVIIILINSIHNSEQITKTLTQCMEKEK